MEKQLCKYYKKYYQGTESKPVFTNECLWFLAHNIDINNYCRGCLYDNRRSLTDVSSR